MARSYRRTPGRCAGCGCPHDERTPDCSNCEARHYMRERALSLARKKASRIDRDGPLVVAAAVPRAFRLRFAATLAEITEGNRQEMLPLHRRSRVNPQAGSSTVTT